VFQEIMHCPAARRDGIFHIPACGGALALRSVVSSGKRDASVRGPQIANARASRNAGLKDRICGESFFHAIPNAPDACPCAL
jgi:hypothetical protein